MQSCDRDSLRLVSVTWDSLVLNIKIYQQHQLKRCLNYKQMLDASEDCVLKNNMRVYKVCSLNFGIMRTKLHNRNLLFANLKLGSHIGVDVMFWCRSPKQTDCFIPHNSGPWCVIHECLASSSPHVSQQKRVHSGQSESLPWPMPAVTFSLYAPPLWSIHLGKEGRTEIARMLKHWANHSLCTPLNRQDCGEWDVRRVQLTKSLQCNLCACKPRKHGST